MATQNVFCRPCKIARADIEKRGGPYQDSVTFAGTDALARRVWGGWKMPTMFQAHRIYDCMITAPNADQYTVLIRNLRMCPMNAIATGPLLRRVLIALVSRTDGKGA